MFTCYVILLVRIVCKGALGMDFDKVQRSLAGRENGIIGEKKAFKSAVLVPLVKVDGEWSILFEVRSLSLKSQPGDICFPGGKIEASDSGPMEATVRETSEELGLSPQQIEVLGPLEKFIPTSEMIIYPYVGIIHDLNEISVQEDEVGEVFTIPLSWFRANRPDKHMIKTTMTPDEDFPFDRIAGGRNYKFRTRRIIEYFYTYESYTIWGMTARILLHFLKIIDGQFESLE